MNLLKKFDEYFNSISEALNNPIDIDWKENDNIQMIGYFEINDSIYKIESKRQIGNNWSFSFYYLNDGRWETQLKNDSKNTFRVLATIKKSIYHLFDSKTPNSIIFSAIDNNDTRKRLYLGFCNEFCRNTNWTISNNGTEDHQLYLLFNNNLDEQDKLEMLDSVKKVIEESK